MATPTVTAARTGPSSVARIGIGFVLLLPALLALAWSYLLPTVLAVWRSTTRDDLLRPADSVGGANYQARFQQGVLGDFGWAMLLALVPLALALLVAPLLALLADRAGRRATLAVRALVVAPVAGYAPVALLVGWRLDRMEPSAVADRQYATLVELTAIGGAGLVVAVATTAFLGTLRGRSHRRDALPAASTVAGLLVFGIIAATLQSFTAPLLTGNTGFPLTHVVVASLSRMDLGGGSAGAVLLLIPLALLGLAATALLLASRARIEVVDEAAAPGEHHEGTIRKAGPGGAAGGGSRRAGTGLAVVGVFFVGLLLWVAWPWLRRSLRFTNEVAPLPAVSLADMLVATWLPTLLSALVTVAVAVAGGFAIGGLRPLGRFSELLLLPFAPWLFVGTGPLAIESYLRTRDADQLNSFLGAVPPGWVSIPALFLFAVLFRGLEPRWRAGGGFGASMLAPSVPMVVLVGLVTWLVTAGQVLWPWIVAQPPMARPAPLEAMVQATTGRIPADDLALGAVLPLPIMLLFLAALVWLQVAYLDRLTVRVGRQSSRGPRGAQSC
ncbi:ABC-type sugar transport system, permease component [Micromonospora phaseoli]|uniref:ABC-type sugar transport system, permease component n=1 Tax=Micromonospora phaseoli TaxID=1144548 RepID=A0A1H6V7G8_9ACTN|nr:sugar ABC transporter permease [Micromonospora phaseoli]PZV93676.1 ABC-type sugar transport system permease subunit [Micromonospora phaseoli]SEJ00468.1 ABC-type sugar transport system, permease component [Micromonospora phaseoli]